MNKHRYYRQQNQTYLNCSVGVNATQVCDSTIGFQGFSGPETKWLKGKLYELLGYDWFLGTSCRKGLEQITERRVQTLCLQETRGRDK